MIDPFEIRVRLQARHLLCATPPDATTETEGDVALSRKERRSGLPERMDVGEIYADVTIEKNVSGRLRNPTEPKEE